jgi:ABC-type multidrug transport system ATPase subunit
VSVLALEGVSSVAGGVRVLDRLDLAVAAAERVAIVAGSGEGKSLLSAIAIGLVPPLAGIARLFGTDLARADAAAVRRLRARCGVTVQGGSLLGEWSVEDNLRLGAGSAARVGRRIDRLMLDFAVERSGTAAVQSLSRGERRRVELVRAFARDPELVILDEPLDGAHAGRDALERAILRQIAPRGRALLLLTQDEAFAARACQRVLRLERGRLV